MPDIVSANGLVIVVDDVDYAFATRKKYRAWFNRGRAQAWMAVADERRFGRVFRLCLHREIAMRVIGEVHHTRRLTVRTVSGDYLDCRRSNLIVDLRPAPKGRPALQPKAVGYEYAGYKGTGRIERPPASPLWAGGIAWKRDKSDPEHPATRRPYIGGSPAPSGAYPQGDDVDQGAGGRPPQPRWLLGHRLGPPDADV